MVRAVLCCAVLVLWVIPPARRSPAGPSSRGQEAVVSKDAHVCIALVYIATVHNNNVVDEGILFQHRAVPGSVSGGTPTCAH